MGFLNLKDLLDDVYKYIDVRVELAKLDTEERLTRLGVLLFQLIVLAIVGSICILFLNIALAYYLNTLPFFQPRPYLGFLAVAGLQVFLLSILGFTRGLLSRRTKSLIRSALTKYARYILSKEDTEAP